jgi:hypothetical protein
MSNLRDEDTSVIKKLQECLLKLNKEIHNMCLAMERACEEEDSLESGNTYERESDSGKTNTRQH